MYMFDTNVFNRILDSVISLEVIAGRIPACATHIQRDEINRTKNPERREALARVFVSVVVDSVPTHSSLIDVSSIDESRISGDRLVPTASAMYGVSTYGEASFGPEDDLYSS